MRSLAIVTTCLMLSSSVFAQSSIGDKAKDVGEKTGVNSVLGVSPTTAAFVTKVAVSDLFEIKASQMAVDKSTGPTKDFATKMVADHTKTSTELKTLLKTKVKDAVVPPEVDKSHQKMLDKLASLNGDDFTKQYQKDQVSAHKSAVSVFERYSKSGDQPDLKAWAGETLPTLQDHLKMAEDLSK
jgi:putative membrane protein